MYSLFNIKTLIDYTFKDYRHRFLKQGHLIRQLYDRPGLSILAKEGRESNHQHTLLCVYGEACSNHVHIYITLPRRRMIVLCIMSCLWEPARKIRHDR